MTGQEGARLSEDDGNDLNVSFSHDDVSMTGQARKGLIKMVLILLLHVRTIVFSTNLEDPDSYNFFPFFYKKQYFSAKPQNNFSYFEFSP